MVKNIFPQELLPFKEAIQATNRDFVRITTGISEKPLKFTTSKFGGKPYITGAAKYPVSGKGEKLNLLAQINFSEVPNLENFPREGLLQIFILNDDLHGINFRNRTLQDTFRIIYIEEKDIDENKAIKTFDWPETDNNFVLNKEYPLKYRIESAPVSPADYNFDKKLNLGKSLWDFEDAVSEWYWEYSKCEGHKIGGYPHFTQEDPRRFRDFKDYTTLLFQMDSDNEIRWGDSGVANFFIKDEDLKNLNFEDVIYTWDCY